MFDAWFNPHPETASSMHRLASTLITFIAIFVVCPGIFILVMGVGAIALGSFRRMFGKKDSSAPMDYEDYKKNRPRRKLSESTEDVSDSGSRPSETPYWVALIFFGFLFGITSYITTLNAIYNHFPAGTWATIAFIVIVLGFPMIFAINRIIKIRKGESIELKGSSAKTFSLMKTTAGVLVIGGLCLGLGFILYKSIQSTLDFEKVAKPSTGVVTRWIFHHGYRSSHFNPEVRYQTPDGKIRVAECYGGLPFDFTLPQVGETVAILYNPNNPLQVKLQGFFQIWGLISLPFFMLALAGLALLRRSLQKQR